MINKDRYIGILSQLLNEHYEITKLKNIVSKERQHYIDGYLTATRALEPLVKLLTRGAGLN
jgi:hypothetical protein